MPCGSLCPFDSATERKLEMAFIAANLAALISSRGGQQQADTALRFRMPPTAPRKRADRFSSGG